MVYLFSSYILTCQTVNNFFHRFNGYFVLLAMIYKCLNLGNESFMQ